MNLKKMMESMGIDMEEMHGEIGKEIKEQQERIEKKLNLILQTQKAILEHLKE